MNGYFFNVFKNHFLKIHRSVLHKITIDILYFEMFMTSVYGEKYGRSICLARQKQYFLYVFQGRSSHWEAFLKK